MGERNIRRPQSVSDSRLLPCAPGSLRRQQNISTLTAHVLILKEELLLNLGIQDRTLQLKTAGRVLDFGLDWRGGIKINKNKNQDFNGERIEPL